MTVELTDLSFEKQLARFVSRSEWSESVRENRDSHLAIIKALDINTAETKAALLRIEEKLDRLQDKR
jgi:hypothetical protein